MLLQTDIANSTELLGKGEPSRVDGEPIRVLLLTSSLERGGAERQVVELANALDRSRFKAFVCSLSRDNPLAPQIQDSAKRVHVIPKRTKYDIGLVTRVASLMKRLQISVVHSFMFDAEMVGRLAGRFARLPAVICSNRCPHLQRSKLKLWLARATHCCFDMMVANSWAGLEFEKNQQHVKSSKLCVVPNGVDISRFRPGTATDLRDALEIPQEARIVGMFAHFRGNKDHETYIKSAIRIAKTRRDVVFVCIGQPDGEAADTYYGQARRLVAEAGVEQQVRFLGGRSDIDCLYKMVDIKVLSTHFEGTPNVVLEAMASGLPVIATDVSDNARIVPHGECGFIVPRKNDEMLAAHLSDLLTDDEKRARFGRNARRRAEVEFSVEALGRRTGEIYLDVLRRKGHPELADSLVKP